jgi:hypothetical protein
VHAALITVTGLVTVGAGTTTAQATKPAPSHKITLCHRTGSTAGGNLYNGYAFIAVDIASVANAMDVRGHDSHKQTRNGPGGNVTSSYSDLAFTCKGMNLSNAGSAFRLANG